MILVTGSAGYIGSEVCKKLESLRYDYIGIDDLSGTSKKNIFNKKKFKKICISDNKKIKTIFKENNINLVIHCAAHAYVVEGERQKKRYTKNNIKKTRIFLKNVLSNKIKNFIFLSSSNVYTEKKNYKKFSENSLTNPKNHYGKTKIYIEKYLLKNKTKFDNLFILRLFNIIGLTKIFFPLYKKFRYQRLLFKLSHCAFLDKKIKINYFTIKNQKKFPSRDFLDIRDLTVLILKIIIKTKKSVKNYKIYNVGKGKSMSLNHVINIFNKYSAKKTKINFKKIDKNEYFHTLASNAKVKKEFKWAPKINMENSVLSYFKFLRNDRK